MKADVIFKESQKVDSVWIYALVAFILLISAIVYTFIKPFDEREFMFTIVFLTLLVVFISTIRLETEIGKTGIYYRFFPLKKKTFIPKTEIKDCYFRIYKPIKEYGGWGIRIGRYGRAYSIRGTKGMQIRLEDDSRILIGTSDEAGIKRAIEEFWGRSK